MNSKHRVWRHAAKSAQLKLLGRLITPNRSNCQVIDGINQIWSHVRSTWLADWYIDIWPSIVQPVLTYFSSSDFALGMPPAVRTARLDILKLTRRPWNESRIGTNNTLSLITMVFTTTSADDSWCSNTKICLWLPASALFGRPHNWWEICIICRCYFSFSPVNQSSWLRDWKKFLNQPTNNKNHF